MDVPVLKEAQEALKQLRGFLPEHGRVLIIPHDYPDPDALASAAATELLLREQYGLRGLIVFTGVVSRAENRELMRHFKYKWRLSNQLREPPAGKRRGEPRRRTPAILVDTAPWSRNVTLPDFVKPVAILDHHPGSRRRQPKGMFLDIRTGLGATASILTEYLVAADIAIPKWLASILAYAIATETLDLSRDTTPRDLAAYAELISRANFGLLGKIRHAYLPRAYFIQLQEAMKNVRTYGRVAWTHLGAVRQPEIVPEIADLLERMERISWAFCTGYMEDRLLISLRSSQKSARCGNLIRHLIGRNGSGGGHQRMAAGYLDLAGVGEEERENRREELIKNLLARIEGRSAPLQEQPLGLVAQPLAETVVK